jgi:hypothetical protein
LLGVERELHSGACTAETVSLDCESETTALHARGRAAGARGLARTLRASIVMDLAVRFVLGGLVVSAFAAIGTLFKPPTFSGLFGAAPSVAIASLALAYHQHGADYVATEARMMVLGGVALAAYSATCVTLTRRHHVPVWFGAGLAWTAWGAVALVLFEAFGGR